MAEIRSGRREARRQARAGVARPQPPQRASSPTEERKRSNFVAESWAELKKVEWPSQNQVIQGTVVVLIACVVVGAYLYLNDAVWKHVVTRVLLGQ
jgi:preprotein translocase subunit SecE